MGSFTRTAAAVALLAAAAAGCASRSRREGAWRSTFDVTACTQATTGRNRFFILEPGYRVILADAATQVAITVLPETEQVDGIETRIIEEREFENGKLKEVSRNFFTICREHGDVFYHGEEVDDYEDGRVVGHGGAWRAGVNGARAGLMMPGRPTVGFRHYQEVAPGVAADRAEIVADDVTLEAPTGKFTGCLKIVETTPLEPGEASVKMYGPGVGMVFDDDMVIVEHAHGKKPPGGPVALPDGIASAYAEVEITEAEMPGPVAAALKTLHPTGRIREVKRETRKGGRIVYAIEILVEGKQYDVEATADGNVLRNEAD